MPPYCRVCEQHHRADEYCPPRPVEQVLNQLLDMIDAEGKKGGWPNIVTWRDIQAKSKLVRELLDKEAQRGQCNPRLP